MKGNKNENGCEINSLLLPKPQKYYRDFQPHHTDEIQTLQTWFARNIALGDKLNHRDRTSRNNNSSLMSWATIESSYLKNRRNTICASDRKYTIIVQLLTVASLHGSFILPSQYQIFPLIFWRVMINSKTLSKTQEAFFRAVVCVCISPDKLYLLASPAYGVTRWNYLGKSLRTHSPRVSLTEQHVDLARSDTNGCHFSK